MFYLTNTMEVSQLVHQERLEEAKQHRLVHEVELAQRLEINGSAIQRMRKLVNRMMWLFF